MSALYAQNGSEYAIDDVSGALLDPTMVHAGRATEMAFFEGMKVYESHLLVWIIHKLHF